MNNLRHWLIGVGVTYGIIKLVALAFSILMILGELFWLWTAVDIGSFWMFVIGLIPPFFIVTCPVGAWSLLFGVPDWVTSLFG